LVYRFIYYHTHISILIWPGNLFGWEPQIITVGMDTNIIAIMLTILMIHKE